MGVDQEQPWYLDSGASNHMRGSKDSFSELDGDVTGTVKFGDGSRVVSKGAAPSSSDARTRSTVR